MRYKQGFLSHLFNVFLYILMLCIVVIMLYPMLNVLSLSISNARLVSQGVITWYPREANLSAYKLLLGNPQIWIDYKNTILYAVVGTFITLLITSLMAYSLATEDFIFKKFLLIFVTVTMFFSGGTIPTFLLIRKLNMINTLWAMVLPGAVSAYTVIIFRTFFESLPKDLRESAYLDGANDFVILFRIILPLSKPLLATFGLFAAVSHWNGWFDALLYLNDQNKYPIQMFLRNILFVTGASNTGPDAAALINNGMMNPLNLQMAAVIVTIAPILLVYPFIQKYFVKGIMIGAIKG